MIKPLPSRFDGFYFDGQSPQRVLAEIELVPEGVRICLSEGFVYLWPYEKARVVGGGAFREPVRLERQGGTFGEFVSVTGGDFIESLRQHAPAGENRETLLDRMPVEGWRMVLSSCVGIVAISTVLYVWGIRWAAETAARYTPVFIEQRLGLAAANILAPESQRCSDRAREQELARIVERLADAAGSAYKFQVIYVRNSMINAFAAPGGYIIVYDGLLKKAETAEEFAGVLAHEIEHVLHRHSTRALARELSGRTLLSLMAVDVAGTPAALEASAALVNLQHRRSEEEEADVDSVPLLARAKVETTGLPRFLRRLHALFGTFEPHGYLSSHPNTLDRAARLDEASRRRRGDSEAFSEALMSISQWEDARMVCGEF